MAHLLSLRLALLHVAKLFIVHSLIVPSIMVLLMHDLLLLGVLGLITYWILEHHRVLMGLVLALVLHLLHLLWISHILTPTTIA